MLYIYYKLSSRWIRLCCFSGFSIYSKYKAPVLGEFVKVDVAYHTIFSFHLFLHTCMCISFNCCSFTMLGAPINASLAFLFLGNAITSRIFGSSAISITILSNPGAAPACGGVPYWNALYNAPNLFYTSSSGYPAISNAFTIISGLWFLTAPEATSYPLHTTSY